MRCVATLLILILTTTGSALASPAASQWASNRIADIRLISAAATTGDATSVPLGLQFRLAEDWKIYWRTSGDAGFPPELRIQASENLSDLRWHWPVPERFSLFGFENYGYGGEIVIPITAVLSEPGRPLAVDAVVHALACNEICVPIEAQLVLMLPAGRADPTAFTQLISRYRARNPGPPNGTGLAVVDAVSPRPDRVDVVLMSDRPMSEPDVFVEADAGYAFGKPSVTQAEGGRRAVVSIPATVPEDGRLAGLVVTLTVVDGDRFFETPAMIGETGFVATTDRTSVEVWLAMFGFAVLGGLILNLMPCVLPVLSLKLLQVLRYGGSASSAIRHGFLASAGGILVSFMLLAGSVIALKTAGHAVGWGLQFQQPVFLTVMVLILTAFAANLFGLFEVPMPAFLGRFGVPDPGRHGAKPTLIGHMLSGAFSTLLATPCSAPFLGTALGFALSRGTIEIMAIFFAMGVGLALPYLLVAAFPGLVGILPRPGRWMVYLRFGLAVALLATAVWLLTVMAAQLQPVRLAVMIGLLLFAGLLLAVWRHSGRRVLPAAVAGLAVLVIVLGGTGRDLTEPAQGRTDPAMPIQWTAFGTERITDLISAGHVVLVDVTADWCLTCKVNKTLVLERGRVAEQLAGDRVIAMRADWTRPDAATASYLASFGRYGIPFNAVYGPAAPDGIVLPELLEEATVLDAFAHAAQTGTPVSDRSASPMLATAPQ